MEEISVEGEKGGVKVGSMGQDRSLKRLEYMSLQLFGVVSQP
jgi:hypothetical protein